MGITAKKKDEVFTEIDREGEIEPDVMDFFEAQQNCVEKNIKKHQPPTDLIESVK